MTGAFELDHVFLCASRDAVERLEEAGLQCGIRSHHAGQGTADGCFFFDNAYLELMWVHSEAEMRSSAVRPTCLWERMRWRETGACPFGVALRPLPAADLHKWTSWRYEAPFLPKGVAIPIVTPRKHAAEPLVFLSLVSGRPDRYPPGFTPPLEHAGLRRTLRKVTLELSVSDPFSEELQRAADGTLLEVKRADRHHMRLAFDGESRVLDFRPALPLSLAW